MNASSIGFWLASVLFVVCGILGAFLVYLLDEHTRWWDEPFSGKSGWLLKFGIAYLIAFLLFMWIIHQFFGGG